MMEYKSNLAKVINNLKRIDTEMIGALDIGMRQGMEAVRGRVVKRQMSGRPGLEKVTGISGKKWRVQKIGTRQNPSYRLGTSAWWLWTHQVGTGRYATTGMHIRPKRKPFLAFQTKGQIRTVSKSGKPLKQARRDAGNWVFTKNEVHIPKRLHVIEFYKSDAHKIVRRAMWQQVAQVLKLRST